MRSRYFATMGTLALLATASAFGQQTLRIDVPFEFSVNNKVLPAGNYDVTCPSGVLFVRGAMSSAVAPANYIGTGDNEKAEARLVFNKYGDKYFLAEAWTRPGATNGAGLPKSRTEREIARANPDVARIAVPVRTGGVTLASLR